MDKVSILIQGHTECCEQIILSLPKDVKTYWSTWNIENIESLNIIRDNGIEIILNEPPVICGTSNVNKQTISTTRGLLKIKNDGYRYVFKIRSDLAFRDLKQIIDLAYNQTIKNKKLQCPCFLMCPTYGSYVGDHFMLGDIDEMIFFWSAYIPIEIYYPPEQLLLNRYMNLKYNTQIKTFEYLKENVFDFLLGNMIDNNNDAVWVGKIGEMVHRL